MSFNTFDHLCMAEALQLARKGLRTTHPNPRVGCVISCNDRVIARGWHLRAGEAHAEINALKEAGDRAAGATVYVTLEPCSHSGRTSPCVNALVEARVSRVVCALKDPNPMVSGAGIARLKSAGIDVRTGLMAGEAEELNAGFLSRMKRGRPYVRVKLAQSSDGHIALSNGDSQWISGSPARADVQQWRARSDAILTGIGTVLADDPRLTVRLAKAQRQPLRVIVDSQWRTPANARLLDQDGEVVIAGLERNANQDSLKAAGAGCLVLPECGGRVDLQALLTALGTREINEVQVEAGATLCGALLEQGLVDEILIYQAPVLLGGGSVSPFSAPRLDNMDNRVHLEWIDSRRVGRDLRLRMRPVYKET